MSWCDTLIGALIVMVIWCLYQPQLNNYMKTGMMPVATGGDEIATAMVEGYKPRDPGGLVQSKRSKSGFTSRNPPREPDDPYTKINKFIDYARGMRASDLANGSLPPWQVPGALERYHQSGATVRPEDITAADQAQWFSSLESGSIGQYNTERAFDSSNDAVGYHESSPIEYNDMITATVLDPRAVENHAKWAESMIPWAGVSTSPDTLDEVLEATTNFTGLRRPQPIAQYNALQVTERDTQTFLGNHKFNFQG